MKKVIDAIVAGLNERQPLNVVALGADFFAGKRVGLVIVDEVNGFCKPGCGPLAPPALDPMIEKMVSETNSLAQVFHAHDMPILVLQECHFPGKNEPPYPPHCEEGSGDELLVEPLRWLNDNHSARVTFVKKSCISGVIGAINTDDGSNEVFKWVNFNDLEIIIVVGICTDICDLQFVQPMLSARNRDLVPTLKDVVVYTEGCATYDLPIEVARQIGLPEFLAHDQDIAHYIGLWLMQMSGAILANKIEL